MAQTIDSKWPLPCPFCGRKPKVRATSVIVNLDTMCKQMQHVVECWSSKCPALPSTAGANKAQAIKRWNTRP